MFKIRNIFEVDFQNNVFLFKLKSILEVYFISTKVKKGHSIQIQQWSGINVFKSSNFCHLLVSMRELFPENLSFISQFSLTLQMFEVIGIVWKFLVCKFLWFLHTPTFRKFLLLFLLELFPESRPRTLSKTFRTKGHFIYDNYKYNLQKKLQKSGAIGQLSNFFQV